ncbi:MAG: mutM2 [Acidobacteria bacterium]|nr:mutM2 [Acidobacteriota bacterium]
MPELPDIVVYLKALEQRLEGETLQRVQIASPFLLRTAVPPITSVKGKKVVELRRLGKRICVGFADNLWLVLHLMIAGRLHWHEAGSASGHKAVPFKLSKSPKNRGLAAFQFGNGTLSLTEAGTQRRASLHLVEGDAGLARLDPGGLEIFATDLEGFKTVLQSANHTLKRALTDPRLFSGIGNAYSDEILFAARLSPVALTQKLDAEQIERLFDAARTTLTKWVDVLRQEAAGGFPEKVTAFRQEMAVHGRYQQPCPRCGAKIQRIRYASNETDYCPSCQTAGKLLADRSLSRLLKKDWPKTPEELEGLTAGPKK